MKTAGWMAMALLSATLTGAADFDHTHATLDGVLRARVKNERVDYIGLKAKV